MVFHPDTATITANNSILNGAAITNEENSTSSVILENGTLWNMSGSSNLTYLVNTESSIHSVMKNHEYKTLTVTDYEGHNGLISLNTFVQGDESPSDHLVIINGGSAVGTTGLLINNVHGAGALTYGNGILVVDAEDGTTESTAFHLADRVVAGPYEYNLYRGSIDESGPENWYLRSTHIDPDDPDPKPDYRAETSLYSSLYSNYITYSRSLLGTFHQRVGAEEQIKNNSRAKNKDTVYMNGGWFRLINRGGSIDNGGISVDGADFRYQYGAAQIGADVFHNENENGQRNFAGFYMTGGVGYSKVDHYDTSAGNANFNSYGFGLYWTHIGANDWYLDGVFQGNYFTPNVHSAFFDLSPFQAESYSISVESGYPLHFKKHWTLEPEVQLMYQNLPKHYSSDRGATLRFDKMNSFITRVGTRLVWDKLAYDERLTQEQSSVWLTPAFSYESQGRSQTQFSSLTGWIPFPGSVRGPWFSLDLGGTIQYNSIVSLFGTVAGETYLNGRGHAYDVMAGLRFNLE